MNLLKNIRVVAVLLLALVFTYLLVSPYIFKKSGVVVSAVDKGNKCGSIGEGDVITNVLGSYVENSEDFRAVETGIKENEYVTMVINNGPGGCTAVRDGYLGLTVDDVPSNELRFGIDIGGGFTAVLEPEKELGKNEVGGVVQILRKRADVYNLPETTITASDTSIRINSLSTEKISWLIAAGKFETKILEEVKLQDSVGKIPVGDNSYSIELVNNSLRINGSLYGMGEEFELEDVKFSIKNMTGSNVAVEATVFENKDVVRVLQGGSVSYNANARTYEFTVPIEISTEASGRFAKVVKKIPTTVTGENIILNGFLVYYLEGHQISRLNIPAEFARQVVKQISIVGFSTSMTEASNTRLKTLGAVESGVLPVGLKVVGMEKYEPRLKIFSMELFGSMLGLVVVSVISVFYWRYKNPSFGLFAVALVLLELALVLGTVAAAQQLAGAVWVINLTTIAGFTAVLIVSSIQMIVLSEQVLKKKDLSISHKYKKIIDVSAAANWAVFGVGFLILFSTWRFFGLTLLMGFVFDVLFMRPVYRDFIRRKVF
jgi:hypothetical protein